MELLISKEDRDSGVDTATRWTARGSNPVWEGDFLFATSVQNGPGAHPESYTMNTEALSWDKSGGGGGCGGAYHSPPSSAEVQSGYSYNSTTPLCLPGVLEDDLYLYSLYSFSRHPVT
jgi:hypothetical protein